MSTQELATRVKFESNNVIRLLTAVTNRDILYSLDKDRTNFHYISEVPQQNCFTDAPGEYKLSTSQITSYESEFESQIHSNRLFQTSFWHKMNLKDIGLMHSKGVLTEVDVINRADMVTPVIYSEDRYF